MIVESHIRLGEPVEPAQEMVDISDRTTMWAVAKIPENETDKIVPGTKARIHIPSLGDELIEVTMAKYGVEADRKAGTIDGIFILENKDGRMKPGMRAEFAIVTSSQGRCHGRSPHLCSGRPDETRRFRERLRFAECIS